MRFPISLVTISNTQAGLFALMLTSRALDRLTSCSTLTSPSVESQTSSAFRVAGRWAFTLASSRVECEAVLAWVCVGEIRIGWIDTLAECCVCGEASLANRVDCQITIALASGWILDVWCLARSFANFRSSVFFLRFRSVLPCIELVSCCNDAKCDKD